LGFKEGYDSFIHPIPTDSSYVFWFRISRELLGLDEDVVCGIVYIPPGYTVSPDFLFEKLLRFFIFIKNPGKTISSKSSVFDSTKQRISNVLTNS
jgi:hypothetical protein